MTGKGSQKAKEDARKLASDKTSSKGKSNAGAGLNKHKVESHKKK